MNSFSKAILVSISSISLLIAYNIKSISFVTSPQSNCSAPAYSRAAGTRIWDARCGRAAATKREGAGSGRCVSIPVCWVGLQERKRMRAGAAKTKKEGWVGGDMEGGVYI